MIRPDAEPLLEINDLHASVEDKPILNGVTLQVKAGEIHAVMGRNGKHVVQSFGWSPRLSRDVWVCALPRP